MALKTIQPCPHEASEMDVASQADGLCPLCLQTQVRIMRTALEEIAKRGRTTGNSRAALATVAIRALNDAVSTAGEPGK
jgi:hypothetical protein